MKLSQKNIEEMVEALAAAEKMGGVQLSPSGAPLVVRVDKIGGIAAKIIRFCIEEFTVEQKGEPANEGEILGALQDAVFWRIFAMTDGIPVEEENGNKNQDLDFARNSAHPFFFDSGNFGRNWRYPFNSRNRHAKQDSTSAAKRCAGRHDGRQRGETDSEGEITWTR